MIINGMLRDGTEVRLQFYTSDDLNVSTRGGGMQPQSWIELRLSEEDARAFLAWLRDGHVGSFRGSQLTARGERDWVLVTGIGSSFTIRLGTEEILVPFPVHGFRVGHQVHPALR